MNFRIKNRRMNWKFGIYNENNSKLVCLQMSQVGKIFRTHFNNHAKLADNTNEDAKKNFIYFPNYRFLCFVNLSVSLNYATDQHPPWFTGTTQNPLSLRRWLTFLMLTHKHVGWITGVWKKKKKFHVSCMIDRKVH